MFPVFLIFLSLTARGDYFRYLHLTPAMGILPRGPLDQAIASDMKCFEVSGTADSIVVRGFNRGKPFPVFDLSHEIVVLRSDSVELWLMNGFRYVIEKDMFLRPVLVSRENPAGESLPGPGGWAFMRLDWEDDSTVTVSSMDSLGEILHMKVPPVYRGTAAKLDENGELVLFSFQSVPAAGFRYTLDELGRQVTCVAVDARGCSVKRDDGIEETRYVYDLAGNTVSISFHNSIGTMLPRDYLLPPQGNWEFDSLGIVVNGCTIAFVKRDFDGSGLYVSETNIGTNGFPVPDDQGRVTTLYQREIHGGICGSYWFDGDSEPVEVAGVWGTRRIYDLHGRVTESSTWDSLGRLTEFPGGFASTRFSYTSDGSIEMISYFDLNENPVVNTVQGCHARFHCYDEAGNLTEIHYLDNGYCPMNNNEGYARVVYCYDSGQVSASYFNQNGERL